METESLALAGSDRHNANDDWVSGAIDRCERALRAARATSDRAALLRSLIRLRGGRVDIPTLGTSFTPDDEAAFRRFGLALTNENMAVRIVDEEDPPGLSGLAASLILDSKPRQVFEAASPDAVLLRLTEHYQYKSVAQKAAVRALLTQPPGSGLMVSMPTGSGKSFFFRSRLILGAKPSQAHARS